MGLSELRTAAQLRARYRVHPPDALQHGTALSTRCSAFLTNDRGLPDLPRLRIVPLERFL